MTAKLPDYWNEFYLQREIIVQWIDERSNILQTDAAYMEFSKLLEKVFYDKNS